MIDPSGSQPQPSHARGQVPGGGREAVYPRHSGCDQFHALPNDRLEPAGATTRGLPGPSPEGRRQAGERAAQRRGARLQGQLAGDAVCAALRGGAGTAHELPIDQLTPQAREPVVVEGHQGERTALARDPREAQGEVGEMVEVDDIGALRGEPGAEAGLDSGTDHGLTKAPR